MAEMKRLDITPILDLLHFGVPDWLGNFQNPELPLHFADYADAVVERYPWVRYFTPVNEIYVSAKASAKAGAVERAVEVRPGIHYRAEAPLRRKHYGESPHRPSGAPTA